MTAHIKDSTEYRRDVFETVLTALGEPECYVGDYDPQYPPSAEELIREVSEGLMQATHTVDHNPTGVIHYSWQGPDGDWEGDDLYIHERSFETPSEMVDSLARAAYYNDVRDALDEIFSTRERLGGAVAFLPSEPAVADGERVTFEYEHGLSDPTIHKFVFEHIEQGEWRVYDPNGDAFEVITPDAHLSQSTYFFPARSIEIWIENMCAKRLREISGQ